MKYAATQVLGFFLVLISTSAFSYDHDLHRNSQKFEGAVQHVAQVLQHRTGYSHISKDARRLVRSAHHFSDAIRNHASLQHLRRDFNKISRDYHHLMQTFDRAHDVHHSHHIVHDVQRMQWSFKRLQQALNDEHHHDDDEDHHE